MGKRVELGEGLALKTFRKAIWKCTTIEASLKHTDRQTDHPHTHTVEVTL